MADDVHFLRFLIIGGRGGVSPGGLDSGPLVGRHMVSPDKHRRFKAVRLQSTAQYGSSLLQSTAAAHNIVQGGVFVEPVPRLELKRLQMLCNTKHLNCAVQLPSRLYSSFRNSGSAGGEN